MLLLYYSIFLAVFIPFLLLLLRAWFKEERPSPGLFLLLLPAILFLIMTIKELIALFNS